MGRAQEPRVVRGRRPVPRLDQPEEGELRPQLLDRFGLTVEVAASREADERVEVVRRRLAYEADPAGFAARWAANRALFPRGVDLVLCAGRDLAALPRATAVAEEG